MAGSGGSRDPFYASGPTFVLFVVRIDRLWASILKLSDVSATCKAEIWTVVFHGDIRRFVQYLVGNESSRVFM